MNKEGEIESKQRVVSGLAWAYAERFMAQGVSLLVTIILARIIAPEYFGAITIVTVFINIANTLAVEGFGTSLIQKKEVDDIDYSSVLFFSLGFSFVVYVLVWICAPAIASFYKMPILVFVLRIMGIRIILGGVNSIQQAYISRRMEFKKFFVSTSFGIWISAIVGVAMAYAGYGIWALVIQYIINAGIDTLVLTFTSGLRIHFVFSWRRLKELLRFGWKLVASSLMISVYSNARDLIVGKKFSAAELAYYNKGNQFPSFIVANINTSISKVLFPTLSSFQEDSSVLKRMTRRAIGVSFYILAPVLIGMAVIAEEFVTIVLTDEWLPSVFYLRMYCIIFLLQPLQTASLQAMKAMGKSDLYLKLEIIKKIIGTIILCISIFAFDNMEYIAWGALCAEVFSTLFNMPANRRIMDYYYKEQLYDILPTAILAIAMGLLVNMCNFFVNVYLLAMSKIFIGAIFYVFISWLFKIDEFEYIKGLILSLLRTKK